MSKILITGNGFDLYHGLPTKYGHFMYVMKVIEEIEKKEEYSFYDFFDENFGLEFFNDNERMHECYDVEKINFDKNSIKEIKILLNGNLWYRHFKKIIELETWIDFEMEIYKFLEEIDDFYKNYKVKNNVVSSVYNNLSYDFVEILDFYEDGIGINTEYIDRKGNLNFKNVFDKLSKSLAQFTIIFNKYLSSFVNQFYENKIIDIKLPFELMDKIYTFNYMPTIEKLYNEKRISVKYLHGKNTENNIVLGISNLPKICTDNKNYFFLKKRQRISNGTNIDFNFDEGIFSSKRPKEEVIFYIIGHSLDESDKDYILKLFEFFKNEEIKKIEICVFYISNTDRDKKIDNLFKIIGEDKITNFEMSKKIRFIELNNENVTKEFSRILKDKVDHSPTYNY